MMASSPHFAIFLAFCVGFASGLLQPCSPQFSGIDGRAELRHDCIWQQQQVPSTGRVVLTSGQPLQGLSLVHVMLSSTTRPGGEAPSTGFSLTVRRLILANVQPSSAPGTAGVPELLPVGLFTAAPTHLVLMDVRLVVSPQVFQQYLHFFAKKLRPITRPDDGNLEMHTDGSSFLNIPYWTDPQNTTELFSVSLLTGACAPIGDPTAAIHHDPSGALPGCNVRAVDNTTLVPTLLRDASIATSQPLLVRIVSNVTLGPGLRRSIDVRRPVILVGYASVPTSVDLGMVVNTMNVTAPQAQLAWQSLILENLAPGDTNSSVIAAPYSTATSTNLWAVYCNRSAKICAVLSNVTMVIPTAQEVNYHVFMYTMYTSPAPSLKQLASFMDTDLNFKALEFSAAPNDTMIISHLLSKSWHFWNVVTTPQTFVAPKLAPPARPFTLTKSGPAPLVQAVGDCSTLEAAMSYNSSRVFVWRLINNITIGEAGKLSCTWPSRRISAPTHIFGQVLQQRKDRRQPKLPVASAATDGQSPSGSAGARSPPLDASQLATAPGRSAGPGQAGGHPLHDEVYSLGFGFVPAVFQIPADSPDKFMQVQNVTLAQLPQQLTEVHVAPGGRRLLGQSEAETPPGIWTVLLWPFQRSLSGTPLEVDNSQLLLPEPEWQWLAQKASVQDSFVVPLQGDIELTFIAVSAIGNALRVGAFTGPGITGSNVWLLPDASAAAAMPGYFWPLTEAPATLQPSSSITNGGSERMSVAAQAAIGSVAAVAGLLAVGLAAYLLHRRRQQQVKQLPTHSLKQASLHGSGAGQGSVSSKHAGLYGSPDAASKLSADQPLANGTASKIDSIAAARAAALVADGTGPKQLLQSGCASASSSSALSDAAAAAASDAAPTPSSQAATSTVGSSASRLEHNVARGLERWRAAVSNTTMQLMQRRMDANFQMIQQTSGSSSASAGGAAATQQQQLGNGAEPDGNTPAATWRISSSSSGSNPALQLKQAIGTGSFGSVYLGNWRGKQVAVKIMHLPVDSMTEQVDTLDQDRQQERQQDGRRRWQRQQNSPQAMAMAEAVISSAMSHPNVVQVYTYMLHPVMASSAECDVTSSVEQAAASLAAMEKQRAAACIAAGAGNGAADPSLMSGWQLLLIMEWCDQGSLREALDRRRLPHVSGTSFVQPEVVLSLSHDVAAAIMHLHSEGIVHGDLKAGNVLLTASSVSSPHTRCSCGVGGDDGGVAQLWSAASSPPLTGKVADFGLAMPLAPADTHATMLARGTPTHMSPELFMSGHVGKACDVYAYGILLYELITGQRAYAGVPLPLLPHEVAVKRLRPRWPPGLPTGCRQLQKLAEACWAHEPQDRPTFPDIFRVLESCCVHRPPVTEDNLVNDGNTAGPTDHQGDPQPAYQPCQQQAGQQWKQQCRVALPLSLDLQQQQQPMVPLRQAAAEKHHQPPQQAVGAADGGNKNQISWSEVIYGHLRSHDQP